MITATIILKLSHDGSIDAWIWDKDGRVPSWVKSDEVYLGGRFVCICLLLMSSYLFVAQGVDAISFIKTSLAGLLMGSIGWDLTFGVLLFKNGLYPFPNWVTLGGHRVGFETAAQRIFFDCFRLVFAVLLIKF